MVPLKSVFLVFVSLNIIGLIALLCFSSNGVEERSLYESSELVNTNISSFPKFLKPSALSKIYAMTGVLDSYAFEDFKLANFVLTQLDVDQIQPTNNLSNFSKAIIGLKHDPEYCSKARIYFAQHPEEIFEDFKLIMDFPPSHLARGKVLPLIGTDIQKYVSVAQTNETKYNHTYNISLKTNGFFINDMAHNYQQIGKSFACLTQSYNHIPGHGTVNRKDKAAESLVKYNEVYADRPQCFNSSKFFPKTWILYERNQCRDFFKHLNSQAYQDLKKERVVPYIRKQGTGAHMAKGVQPMDEEEEAEIRKIWKNGTGCGTVKTNYIIQDFIHNPLLVEGHKFDFRIYMLVASSNPVMLFYHDGFLRVSVHKYDIHSKDKSVLLTNTELSKESFKKAADGELVNGMNETELRSFQMWNFDRLKDYLLENKVISDPNWLDNYLRPEFKKAMIHLIRMAQGSFLKISSLHELFGVDFMLDENLNLWFLECNSGPVLTGSSEEKEKFMITMLKDHFEIIHGLLKSRTKRIINYVNKVVREIQASKLRLGKYELTGLAQKKEDFKLIIQNKFEPEFEPAPTNTWHKIIDENYSGAQRYLGYLDDECL